MFFLVKSFSNSRCLVPKCDGVKCTSSINKESLWDRFYTAAPAQLRLCARAIQHNQESLTRLASRYHINAKTVAKWRKRSTIKDAPMGPRHPHSTVLTKEQETQLSLFAEMRIKHLFDRICQQHKIEHRLTKVNHSWMRRTSWTDESYYQRGNRQTLLLWNTPAAKRPSSAFLTAYNACQTVENPKRLDYLRIHQPMLANQKERFKINPHHLTVGLNTYRTCLQLNGKSFLLQ